MEFKQLILLGPPGTDVQTQAQSLAQRWHVPHVSMDRLIAAAGSLDEPLSDTLIIKLLRKRFEQPDVMLQGWVLDGFPLSLVQAQGLNDFLAKVGQPMAKVAYLKAMTGLLINRLTASGGHEPIPAIRQRLAQHQASIAPVLDYYQHQEQLTTINASRSAAEINQALAELFQEETGTARFIQDESELDSLLEQESLLVVDCMASWCGSCKLVTPLIDQLAETYKERVNVMKIDFDANQQVPKRFGLKGMPAVMFFKDGELMETLTGVKPYQAYSAALTRFLE